MKALCQKLEFQPQLLNKIAIFLAVAWLISAGTRNVFAEQCNLLEADQSKKAATYLHVGDTIVQYCELCKTEPYKIKIQKLDGVSINGQGMDIAYIYVRIGQPDASGKARFENLALLAGCPTEGVTPAFMMDPLKYKDYPPPEPDDWSFLGDDEDDAPSKK